ncbi:hypothetical protein [Micromonospora wenchangensis]|uniref:hypothetical protein n=1 Tax=Micromonospora wenchangensis TaxID=1185415 RepID=UPI0037F4B8E0
MSGRHEEIAELRRYADHAVRELTALRPGTPHLTPRVERARALADRLRLFVNRDISVGFAGLYTTGKSLLLSLLLDTPGLLPVANEPTTGNVTRIKVRESAGPQPPHVGITVTYLTPADVADLATAMVARIAELDDRSPARPGHSLRGYRPVDPADPDRSDWQALTDHFAPVWHDPALSRSLRGWVTELCRLRDALQVGSGFLARVPGGSPIGIDAARLTEAVTIGASRDVPAGFPAPSYEPPFPAGSPTGPMLAATQPLIDEITIELRVPPGLLPFDGTPVDLLDFPGLNSGSLRDRFLAERKVPTTTSILIVLNGRAPVSDDVTAFFDILKQGRQADSVLADSVLVAANRFDPVLPPPGPPARTVAELTGRSADLHVLLSVAHELTGGRLERLALTSALAAAADRGWPPPSGAIADEARTAALAAQRWQPTVDALAATEPQHPVTRALAGFVRPDGGLAHLRDLLIGHVRGHGLRIWLTEARALRAAVEAAWQEVAPPPAQDPPDRHEARLLADLERAVTRAGNDLRRRLIDLRVLAGTPDQDGTTLDQRIEAEAAALALLWPWWEDTLERAPEGQLRVDADDSRVLTATGQLVDTYQEALDALDRYAEQELATAVRDWATAAYATPALRTMVRLLTAGAEPLRRRLGTGDRERLTRLASVTFLTDPLGAARRAADARTLPAAGYPLAENRALAWHPAVSANGHRADSAHLYRLRRDLVASLASQVRRRSQDVLDELAVLVRQQLNEAEQSVPRRERPHGPAQRPDPGTKHAKGEQR